MRPPTPHELELAMFLEMYVGGLLAVLIPLGFGHLAYAMAANARHVWHLWKLENDAANDRIDSIMAEYTKELYATTGPNRVQCT